MPITDHHQHARWPLPQGVVDLFYEDAAGKRQLEQALRTLFTSWSYDELIPPTFEYADTLASEAGTQIAEEMYRFTDRDGRTLALRPDLTVPTARVVGTRLYDQPMPLRLFYVGPVFRYERPAASGSLPRRASSWSERVRRLPMPRRWRSPSKPCGWPD